MTPSEANAARLRAMLAGRPGIGERRMFGGVCFMQGEHMLCGADRSGFLFRVGPAGEAPLRALGGEVMQQAGRPLRGFVWLRPGDRDDASLARGLALAADYVGTLPAKPAKRSRKEPKA